MHFPSIFKRTFPPRLELPSHLVEKYLPLYVQKYVPFTFKNVRSKSNNTFPLGFKMRSLYVEKYVSLYVEVSVFKYNEIGPVEIVFFLNEVFPNESRTLAKCQ